MFPLKTKNLLNQLLAGSSISKRRFESVFRAFSWAVIASTLFMINGCTAEETCEEILPASFRITNEADAAAILEFCEISGDLTIDLGGSSLKDIELVNLKSLGGVLRLASNPDIERLIFPLLETIDGGLVIEGNKSLVELGLDSLTRLGGSALFRHNASLQSLEMPALESIDLDLMLTSNDALELFSVPRLSLVLGALVVSGNPVLEALEYPELRGVAKGMEALYNPFLLRFSAPVLEEVGGGFALGFMPLLSALELSMLRQVHGYFSMEQLDSLDVLELLELEAVGNNLWILSNEGLVSFATPDLVHVGTSLKVGLNPRLAVIRMSKLERIGTDALIFNNSGLPQCLVDAVIEDVQSAEGIGGKTQFCDLWGCNLDACTCSRDLEGIMVACE